MTENSKYKGYDALNFDFIWKPKDKNMTPRIYVTRFVKTDNFVYWLNYSIADWNSEGVIKQHNFENAEKFFDSVKFEKGF